MFKQFSSLLIQMEEDQFSFNMTIQVMQNQTNINTGEILKKYKIT
jgi:hypothetical protein